MPQALRVTDGTTTVMLSSGDMILDHYLPSAFTGEDITETAEVVFGVDFAAERTSVAMIDRLFEQARRYQRLRIGNAVYVEYKPSDADTNYYRSELKDGRVMIDTFKRANVIWTREPFWEGPETQIPLTGIQGTDVITDLTIYNPNSWLQGTTISFDATTKEIRDSGNGMAIFKTDGVVRVIGSANNDGSYTVVTGNVAAKVVVSEAIVTEAAGATVTLIGQKQNYVSIAAADVVGDLPAPPRLEIKNNYNSTTRAANVFVAHNVDSNPGTLAHILEAENATGGTTTINKDSSGGYDKALSWEVTTETELLDWTISTDVLNACAGNFFRLLIRLASNLAYSDLWLKVKIKMELTVIWESEWILAPNGYSLFELATAQLPAYLAGAGDIYPAHLLLFGRRNAAGTHTLNVDYMQLSPLDGWRKLQPQGYNLGYLARLMDDMIDDYLYTDSWDTPGKFGNYYTASTPLALIPNKLQRLYFLHDVDVGGSAIARTLGVKVFYRPRRCSI